MNKKKILNTFKLKVPAIGKNEAYCRSVAVAFAVQADPNVEEIADIKTVISEAVTNCIVHAYKNEKTESKKIIYINCVLYDDYTFKFTVKDNGCGIENIEKAMEPLFTTDAENERSGMGLPIMKSFSDAFKIKSEVGRGTVITFTKKISNNQSNDDNRY